MKQTTIKALPKGEFFTLKPIEEPTERQVYIRGDFERLEGCNKYCCTNYGDANKWRFFKGSQVVYTDFYF